MNETENSGYLSNPYVLIGTALLIYWYIQRRNLIRNNENALKHIGASQAMMKVNFEELFG